MTHDYDWIVVGSGFGGSVSALRLAEKGYSVAVLECGKPLRRRGLPESTWRHRAATSGRRGWGCAGVFRISFFKDVVVVCGSGVGGGSLGYANTLYRARPRLLRGPAVGRPGGLGGRARPPLRHGRADARRRRHVRRDEPADQLLREFGEEIGVGDTYPRPASASSSTSPAKTVPDPYFEGEGPEPDRLHAAAAAAWSAAATAPRTRWSRTTSGSPSSSASRCTPSAPVTEIRPLGAADGSDGYAVTSERSGSAARPQAPHAAARAA